MKNVKKHIIDEIFYLVESELYYKINKHIRIEMIDDVREKLQITFPQLNHNIKKNLKL
jgi:hypothetical protein